MGEKRAKVTMESDFARLRLRHEGKREGWFHDLNTLCAECLRLLCAAAAGGVEPGGAGPVPLRGTHGLNVAIDKGNIAASGVPRLRSAPIGIEAGDATDTG